MRIVPRPSGTTYVRTWLLAVLGSALAFWIVLPATAQTPRAPIPDAARQREIVKLLEETYGLGKLESASKKQQAVKKLLEATSDDTLSGDERYVILTTLLKLTQEIADFASWRRAVDKLGASYDIDAGQQTSRYLKVYLDATTTSAAFKGKIVDEIASMIQQAASDNRYADADSLLAAADAVAQRVKASSAIKQTLAKTRESIADRQQAWKQFQAASAKLAMKSDDAAANLTAGRWQAFYQSDWSAAVPHFQKSQAAKWKAAADWEHKAPQEPAEQVVAGDVWWDLAQAETGIAKTALLLRAGSWYDKALPDLTAGVQKQLLTKRLAEIALLKPVSAKVEVAAKVGTASPGIGVAPQQPGEWVDILDWAVGLDWSLRGHNWNQNLNGPPTKEGITTGVRRANRFPLPAIIDGDYEMEVEFTRTQGNECVAVFFPVGTHNMHLECGANGGNISCVHWINGKSGFEGNGTERRPGQLSNGVRHRLFFRVKQAGDQAEFHIDLDQEKDYIQWKGPSASLTNTDWGDWRVTSVQHPWVGGWDNVVQFHKVRVRMLSGTLRRDVITDADREQDLKEGLVRLVGEPAISPKVGWAEFLVNQVPWQLGGGEAERIWPLISRDPAFSRESYGAHAPSRLRCEIPPGAKSFSAIGYNDSSRTTSFQVLIDGKPAFDSGVTAIALVKLDIPLKSKILELVIDEVQNNYCDRSYWCYPRFHNVTRDKFTDKLLDGKPGPLKFAIASHSVGFGTLTYNRPLDPVIKTLPLHFQDVVPCHEFLFAHGASTVTYRVPDGMTRFSAVGYNVRSQHTKFEVWADGRNLYESAQAGIVPIQVKLPGGVKSIELRVNGLGDNGADLSMWCYPRLHKK